MPSIWQTAVEKHYLINPLLGALVHAVGAIFLAALLVFL